MSNGWSESNRPWQFGIRKKVKNDLCVNAMHRERDQLGSG